MNQASIHIINICIQNLTTSTYRNNIIISNSRRYQTTIPLAQYNLIPCTPYLNPSIPFLWIISPSVISTIIYNLLIINYYMFSLVLLIIGSSLHPSLYSSLSRHSQIS